jgi:glutamate decarboxylase
MIPAYTMPPDAEEVVVMRALVKENVSHAAAHTLHEDIAAARKTLEEKGGLHEADRKRVKTGTGY